MDKNEGIRPPNPPPVRAAYRLTLTGLQIWKQEERLVVSLDPFQRGIEVEKAKFPDLRELYLHETKG